MTKERRGPEPVVIPAEIHSLLERRATFQAWLGKLGGLRQKFRPEVAARVEEDYRGRLAQVESELATHRSEIESALGERRKQAAELSGRRDAQAVELEEVELRYAVGELPDGDWERLRRRHEDEIAELDRSIDAEREAVSELEAIVADLAGERPAPAPARGRQRRPPAAVRGGVAAEAESEAPEGAEDEGAAAPIRGLMAGHEDVEAEAAAAARVGGEAEEGGEAAEPEEDGEAAEPEEDLLDELEFLDSLALEDAGRFDAVSRMLDEPEERGER